VGSNLSTGRYEVFSHETYPLMDVKLAIRISMAIPYYFTSVKFNDCIWVDGGLVNNYPIHVFDNRKYISDPRYATGFTDRPFNKQSLGLRVDPVSAIFSGSSTAFPPNHATINSFGTFTNALLSFILENAQPLSAQDRDRTIFIDEANVSATDFELRDELKNDLKRNGALSTRYYLRWFAAGQARFMKIEDSPSNPSELPALSLPKRLVKAPSHRQQQAQQLIQQNSEIETKLRQEMLRTLSLKREISTLQTWTSVLHVLSVLFISFLSYLVFRYWKACRERFDPFSLDDHMDFDDN